MPWGCEAVWETPTLAGRERRRDALHVVGFGSVAALLLLSG